MAKKQEGYLSGKEARRISKENRKITNQFEKKRKRRNVPESEYLTQMHDASNAVEFDNRSTASRLTCRSARRSASWASPAAANPSRACP